MDVIQAARELGKAIQADERFLRLNLAQQQADEDNELQEKIKRFNDFRGKLTAEIQKPERDQAVIAEMNGQLREMYAEITGNPRMSTVMDSQNEIKTLLAFINQIITGSTEGRDPDLIEYEESCGGDCGGCSGCG